MGTTATNPPKAVNGGRLDWLYHGPLEEFTPRRDALVQDLKADGEDDAAKWAKGLRKPTRAAWLVNQLSSENGRAIRRLLKASAELRAAQDEMLAGSTDHRRLRSSATKERKAIDSLISTAEKLGREEGVGRQVMSKVSETLQAAASDPEVAEALELGRLDREQQVASLGLAGSASAAPAPRKKGKGGGDDAEARERRERAKRRQAAERKLAAAERKLEREQERVEKAEAAVEEAEQRLHRAELDASAARRALADV